jgi:hypothetical protein
MFGGLAFMLDGKMCCGIVGERLMLRLGADLAEKGAGTNPRLPDGLHRHADDRVRFRN